MTSADVTMSSTSSRPLCPPPLEIENLPHVVLRELLPMFDTSSKLTLRLVSQNLRDLIDTQKNFRFNVTLSDATSATVLRFNHFDFDYFPRVLHRLQVTTLLSPLKVFSTSISRCPLPPEIQVLEFLDTRGISQDNFLKLVKFYGRSNSMKKLSVNMMAVEKVEEVNVVKQGLKMNFVEELELTFPSTLENDIRFPRLLLGGVFPSLHTLTINCHLFGGYYPFLYKEIYLFVSRNLASLKKLDILHPPEYYDPKAFIATKNAQSPLNIPGGTQRLAKVFHLRPQTLAKYQKKCDQSRVTSMTVNVPWNEAIGTEEQEAVLGVTFLLAQKHLVHVQLYNFPCSGESCELLQYLINNCATTLVTLELVKVIQHEVDVDNNLGDMVDIHLDIGHYSNLKKFAWTFDNYEDWNFVRMRLQFPEGLEDIMLHRFDNPQLEMLQARMTKLKTYQFSFQEGQRVELEKIQILLGDEGSQSLEKVTLFSGQWEWRRIRDWVKGRGIEKPRRDVTINKITEVDRFTGRKLEKFVLSREPLP